MTIAMFDLHTMTLTNFRSYKGTHEFTFPVADGLYFLTGKNMNEAALGANGAGKSTLLDAITWVLFGRTTRGLKANEVLSWGADTCAVTLTLTVGKERFQIQRTQKPNGLFLSDKPVDQQELQKHIRLNYEAFLYAVINTQFGQPFLSLAPSAKLALFSDIMGLEIWLTKSDKADKETKALSTQLDALALVVSKAEGQKDLLSEDIGSLKAQEGKFEAEKTTKKKEISEGSLNLLKEIKHSKQHLSNLLLEKKEFQFEKRDILESVSNLTTKRDATLAKVQAFARNLNSLKADRLKLENQKYTIHGLPDTCPTCAQHIKHSHTEAKTNEIEKAIIRINSEIETFIDQTEVHNKRLVKYKLAVDTRMGSAALIEEIVSEVIAKIATENLTIGHLGNKLDVMKDKLHQLDVDTNPYSKMLITKKAALAQLEKSVIDTQKTIDQLQANHEAVSFWIKGFKRVRLFIIEHAFRTLEVEVNNTLAQLGMLDWQISFDIERENKSGGVTKGFVVFVKSPGNTEPVRWENWSGGETQRLQLAGDLGLANLIMQQNGLRNTIEFFDEPSTHLSPEGMLDLADMLHDRATSESKRIWIVDHASITNFGEFEGIITIRKNENGSFISNNDR